MPFWKDASFQALLNACPRLARMTEHLPRDLEATAFEGQAGIKRLASAYQDHGYGFLFYALARALKPATCVELGVYQGFSLLMTAAALRDNDCGAIEGFDLFDDYPYRHEPIANALRNIRANGLERCAHIQKADASAAHERFAEVDWLHVDISNDGDTYRRIFTHWASRVRHVILLEGGSPERDRLTWMTRFGKAPIVPAIEAIRREHPQWLIAVLTPFPSLTVAIRAAPLSVPIS
jgi:predicted O-methyltransferase YrrM